MANNIYQTIHQGEDEGSFIPSLNDQTLLPEPNSLERQEREDALEIDNERIDNDRSLKKTGLDFDSDIGIDTDKAEELGKGQDACNTQSQEEVPNHQDEDKGSFVSSKDQTLPELNSLERQEREDVLETNNERIDKYMSSEEDIILEMLENNDEFRRSYHQGYEAGYDEGEQVAEFEDSNQFTLLDTTGIDLETADPTQSGYNYGYNNGYNNGYHNYNNPNELENNLYINLLMIQKVEDILKMYNENEAFKKGYDEAYWKGHNESYIKDTPLEYYKLINILDIDLFVDPPFEAGYACGYNNGYKEGRIKYINEHNEYMVETDEVSHHDIDTEDQNIDDIQTVQRKDPEYTVAGNSQMLFQSMRQGETYASNAKSKSPR